MSRIARGYGTGLAATLKTIQLISQARRALEKAKADADIRQIHADIERNRRREIQAIRLPAPPPRPNPALDNYILRTRSRQDDNLRNPVWK